MALAFLACHLFAVYTFLLLSDLGGQWRAEESSLLFVLISPWLMTVYAYPLSLPFVLPFAVAGIAFVTTRQRQPIALFLAAGGLCGSAAILLALFFIGDLFGPSGRVEALLASFVAGLVGGGTFKLFLKP